MSCNQVTWNINLFQNGELDAWDEHNMGPAGPMKRTLTVVLILNYMGSTGLAIQVAYVLGLDLIFHNKELQISNLIH